MFWELIPVTAGDYSYNINGAITTLMEQAGAEVEAEVEVEVDVGVEVEVKAEAEVEV